MALSGGWKEARAVQAGARKWGTGVNPVHALRTGDGRHVAPDNYDGVDSFLTTQWEDDGFIDYNAQYEADTGIDDRPRLGDNNSRSDADGFPSYGQYQGGVPGGTEVRGRKHGVRDTQTLAQFPTETVSEGWINKPRGDVEDAVTSDTSQLLMQTSMMQRDKVREGSQRGEGSQSEYVAPIQQHIAGQRIKVYSGGKRHEDMLPKTQTQRLRGWWNRTAGTGRAQLMQSNAQQQRTPVARTVPADPYVPPPAVVDAANYGYQEEDVIPYA